MLKSAHMERASPVGTGAVVLVNAATHERLQTGIPATGVERTGKIARAWGLAIGRIDAAACTIPGAVTRLVSDSSHDTISPRCPYTQ